MEFAENETLELKRSTSELKEGIKSIVAMPNKHRHGELYFGIRDDGTIVGQEIGKDTLRNISISIANHIEPRICPTIETTSINGKTCIQVRFRGNDGPYYAYGRGYQRVGDEDRRLTPMELEKKIVEKNKEKLRWDTRVDTTASISDLSEECFLRFVGLAGLKFTTIENILEKLSLISNGNLLNTAVILFAENPERFFPNLKLRCAVFGRTTTDYIIDRQEFSGDIFFLIDMAEKYILENIHIGMKIEGMYREDIPEIDREAFREAIINAFCHRDYQEYDSVNIAIFKDRVEVRSPGGLYGGITIDQITSGMISKRRNELLAEMLHRVHYVEKWGRGIELILSREPETSFIEIAETFITTFRRKNGNEQVIALGKEGVQGSVKSSVKTSGKILSLMRENPQITVPEIAILLGRTTRAIEKQVAKLKGNGRIERIGPDKGGRWMVNIDDDQGSAEIKLAVKSSEKGSVEVQANREVKSIPDWYQAGTMLALSRHQVETLHTCMIETGITELMRIAGRTDRTKFRNHVLNPLIEAGFLEMTVPDKPRSRKQKYRLTDEGRALLGK